MKAALLILGIITTCIIWISFGGRNSKTSLNVINKSMVNTTNLYIYRPKEYNHIDTNRVNVLTEIEFYILESLKNTSYSFYVIGGWIRDRVRAY
jgi:hypothetical protein